MSELQDEMLIPFRHGYFCVASWFSATCSKSRTFGKFWSEPHLHSQNNFAIRTISNFLQVKRNLWQRSRIGDPVQLLLLEQRRGNRFMVLFQTRTRFRSSRILLLQI